MGSNSEHAVWVLKLINEDMKSFITVVLNSRDCYENVWLPKIYVLESNLQNVQNQLQKYLYNTNTVITAFKVQALNRAKVYQDTTTNYCLLFCCCKQLHW